MIAGLSRNEKARGVEWLLAAQHEDGGWGVNLQDDESGWLTAWAAIALRDAPNETAVGAARRGIEWLLGMPVIRLEDPIVSGLLGIDPMLAGWPWLSDGAAWVEPTALSIIALAAFGATDHPRFAEGVAYLLDRVCLDGGWNFGNPLNFRNVMPPTPHQTVLALLALRAAGVDKDDTVIIAAIEALGGMMTPELSVATVAWGALALRTWQIDDASVQEQLWTRQLPDGSWENSAYATAVALLALQEEMPALASGGSS
jgi:hypothetical protein